MLERRRNGKIDLSKFCLTFGKKRLSKYGFEVKTPLYTLFITGAYI